MRLYNVGDEIKISYGKKSTLDRLFYNGFICDDSSCDYAVLHLGIGQMSELKKLILNRFGFKKYLVNVFYRLD